MRYFNNDNNSLIDNVIKSRPNDEEVTRSIIVANDIINLANPSLVSYNSSSLYSILMDAPKDLGFIVGGCCDYLYTRFLEVLKYAKIVSNTSTNPGLFYGYVEPSLTRCLSDANMLISYPEVIISESSTFLAGEIISILVRNNYNPISKSCYDMYILPVLSELIIAKYKDARSEINIIRLIQQKMFQIASNLNRVRSQLNGSIRKDTRLKLYSQYNNLIECLNAFYIVLCLYSKFSQDPDDLKKKICDLLDNKLTMKQIACDECINANAYTNGLKNYSKYLKKV